MSHLPAHAPFSHADYETIAAAVLETARGRWFLTEYARRNRNSDTRLVLEAVEKLERSLAQRANSPDVERMRLDLLGMSDMIAQARAQIAAIKPSGNGGHLGDAFGELDSIVAHTEEATSDILDSVEHIQEIGRTMREEGVNIAVCNLIDAYAAKIYSACSFQDMTGQRIRKVTNVLRFLDARIEAMLHILQFDDIELVEVEPAEEMPRLTRVDTAPEWQQRKIDEILTEEDTLSVAWHDDDKEQAPAPLSLDDIEIKEIGVVETVGDCEPVPDSDPKGELNDVRIDAAFTPEIAAQPLTDTEILPVHEEPAPGLASDEMPVPDEEPKPMAADAPLTPEIEPEQTAADATFAPEPEPELEPEPTPKEHLGSRGSITSLSLTERMALFS